MQQDVMQKTPTQTLGVYTKHLKIILKLLSALLMQGFCDRKQICT